MVQSWRCVRRRLGGLRRLAPDQALSAAGDDTADTSAADDATAACPNSFAGTTPVLLADGTSKPISQVKVGDQVANAVPGSPPGLPDQTHTVTAVHVTHNDVAYTDVTVNTEHVPATIVGTAHHLYWDATTHRWTPANQLNIGDRLQTTLGAVVTITALRDYTTTMVTYNLTIDTLHTYYVEAGTTSVLVHNQSCPPGFDYEAAASSGEKPDKNGLLRVGREYQKHMGRGELPTVSGANLDEAGQNMLTDILTDPNADYQPVTTGRFAGGYRIIGNEIVNNRFVGATFDSNGDFQYFGVYP